jgi:hypothetical protein
VIVTGEVDGTTYLIVNGPRRGIGDLELELVDCDGASNRIDPSPRFR